MGDLDDQLQRLANRRAERTPATGVADVERAAPGHAVRRWPYFAAAAAVVLFAGLAIALATRDDAGLDTLERQDDTQHIELEELGIEFDIPTGWARSDDPTFLETYTWGDGEAGLTIVLNEGEPMVGAVPVDAPEVDRAPTDEYDTTIDGVDVTVQVFGAVEPPFATTVVHLPVPIVRGEQTREFLSLSGDVAEFDAILGSMQWLAVSVAQHIVLPELGIEFDIPADWEAAPTRTIADYWEWTGDSQERVSFSLIANMPDEDGPEGSPLYPPSDVRSVDVSGSIGQVFEYAAADRAVLAMRLPPIKVGVDTPPVILMWSSLTRIDQITESIRWIEYELVPTNVIDAADPEADYDLVAATSEGIELRRRTSNEVDLIPGPPTQVAFLAGENNDYLVSEVVEGNDTRVQLRRNGEQRELGFPIGPAKHDEYLLDVATLDGRPTALVVVRNGFSGMPDLVEELILVDIETGEMTTVLTQRVAEAGIDRGFLSDGAIVYEFGGIGDTTLAVIGYDGTALWSVVVDGSANEEPQGQLVVRGAAAYWTWFEQNSEGVVKIHQDLYEVATGDYAGTFHRILHGERPPSCQRIERWTFLVCSAGPEDPPLQIDLEFGTLEPVPGLSTGVVTTAHTASRSFGERHPCGLSEPGFEPHDFLESAPIELDDGRTMNVGIWSPDGTTLVAQGWLTNWRTNRIELLGEYIEGSSGDIAITGPSDLFDGSFIAFVPDSIFTEEVPTGYTTTIEFDGCDLVATSRGIVN